MGGGGGWNSVPSQSSLQGGGFVLCLVRQSYLTFCDPMDSSLPGSSVHGILQARTEKWVAMPFSRGSSQPSDWSSHLASLMSPALASRFSTTNTTWNANCVFPQQNFSTAVKKKFTEHPGTMKVMKHSWYIKHMDELIQSNAQVKQSHFQPHMNPFQGPRRSPRNVCTWLCVFAQSEQTWYF